MSYPGKAAVAHLQHTRCATISAQLAVLFTCIMRRRVDGLVQREAVLQRDVRWTISTYSAIEEEEEEEEEEGGGGPVPSREAANRSTIMGRVLVAGRKGICNPNPNPNPLNHTRPSTQPTP
jgi:hypothetical protein